MSPLVQDAEKFASEDNEQEALKNFSAAINAMPTNLKCWRARSAFFCQAAFACSYCGL